MRTQNNSDIKKMVAVSALILLIPLGVLWYQHHRLHAANVGRLWVQIFSDKRGHFEAELGNRDSDLISSAESQSGWSKLRQSMEEQGATDKEVHVVLTEAQISVGADSRGKPLPHLPLLAQKGWVQSQPVWVVVLAKKAVDPGPVEVVTGWDYTVRVVNPRHPQEVSSLYAKKSTFPRCYGPNTPFPVGY